MLNTYCSYERWDCRASELVCACGSHPALAHAPPLHVKPVLNILLEIAPMETSNKSWKQHKESSSFCCDALILTAITLCCQINLRMICILAILHVGAVLLLKIAELFHSVCCRQEWWMMGRDKWTVHFRRDLMEKETECSGYQTSSWLFVLSLRELFSELRSIDHSPSIPISSCLPFCFSIALSTRRPIRIGSTHQSPQPSFNLLLSKSIHCSFSA